MLRKGLSPLATTISTDTAAPLIAGIRLRAGKAGSGKGAGRMVAQAIATARAAGVTGDDPGARRLAPTAPARWWTRAGEPGPNSRWCWIKKGEGVGSAIDAIADDAWAPVRYPGAVRDPDTGEWISDAEVAEIPYTAFASTANPDHRPVGRAPGQRRQPVPTHCSRRGGITPSSPTPTEPVADADITHRRHAIIETTFADLIDGPLAHMPSGQFGANSAWALCAAIAHNLLRAAGILASARHSKARGSTLRRTHGQHPRPTGPATTQTDPAPTPPLALESAWLALWHNTIGSQPIPESDHHHPDPTTGANRKSWTDQRFSSAQPDARSRSTVNS